MKIFFSTLFDQQTYPENIFLQNSVAIGNRHMGPLALLDFLELHLGLPGSCASKMERIFNYRKNLLHNSKGTFYEKSIKTNDLEVAIKLLTWRDELKIAGWDFKTDKTTPARLQHLANAEKPGIGDHNPERFCRIIEALNDMPKLPLVEIILHEPPDLLPSHLTQLFALLSAAGINIIHHETTVQETLASDLDNLRSFVLDKNSSKEKSGLKGDGSIQILRFGDLLSGGKGLAALLAEDYFKPVVINEPVDVSLSLSLMENGLPSTGQAMQSVSHPDLQLLAILPVWLWKPYNPQQVLDFFLSPLNIFPRGLSARWIDLFSENPGIHLNDWLEQIDEYVTITNSERDNGKHKERLDFILNTAEERSKKISIEKIAAYYNFFYSIFNKRCAVTTDEPIRTRLQRLCNAFKQMIDVIRLAPGEELDAHGLQKLLELVLQPISIVPFEKQAGSVHEIPGAGLLAGDCDDLLWFGFTANNNSGTLWDEWTTEESAWLQEKKILVDTAVIKAKRDFWFLTQWLRFVKKRLILVIPSVVNGEPAQAHPFHPFLNACFESLHPVTINVERPDEMHLLNTKQKLTEKITIHPIPAFPGYWKIETGLLTKREKEESFSSLEKLMKYPYRWVLEYKAKLYRGNTPCLPANFTFYGTLSHKIFQELLLMPGILKMGHNELKKIYSDTTEKFINQKGLLLYTQGEEGVLKTFREYLFEKFLILIKHLKDNNWQVEGCEIVASGTIGQEAVGGRCDLLLKRIKNKMAEKAIVDLKYSGRNKHRKLMEDGEDLQLAIYSKIFHPLANYCPTSYFVITEGLLFTTCKDAFNTGIILRQGSNYVNTYSNVLNKIDSTIKFRRKEFSEGKIEVGENVSIDELDIFNLDKNSYIVPKQESSVKCRSDYNDYVTFIDTE
ncbi:MAG: PD-(D/E)XK nuclease family protein [Ginsengibacter sp.]